VGAIDLELEVMRSKAVGNGYTVIPKGEFQFQFFIRRRILRAEIMEKEEEKRSRYRFPGM